MTRLFQRIKSVRLAVGLIVYLTLASILATLVPQGAAPEEYRSLYPEFLSNLVLQTGFDRYYSSPLFFLLPAFLFFINLSTCTVDRFARELRKKGQRRHGPDILHLGLVFLTVGAVVSASLRSEENFTLVPGSYIVLPDKSTLRLEEFRSEEYPDGRPKGWTSVCDLVDPEGTVLLDNYELKVNSPLRHGGYAFFQASFNPYFILELGAPDAPSTRLFQGEKIDVGDDSYYFMAPAGGTPALESTALIRAVQGQSTRVIRAAPGDLIGDLKVLGIHKESATIIQAVRDPGYNLVLPAMLIAAFGIAITFIQKIRELL